MKRRAAAALVASAIAVAVTDPVNAMPRERTQAATLVATLRQRPVTLVGRTITGTVDFRTLGVVQHAFTCRRCDFADAVLGPDVVFQRALDLSGSHFRGAVTMPRTTFRGPAMFGGPDEADAPHFSRSASFALASFEDVASFENATFDGEGTFTSARFGGDVVFAHARFKRAAGFRRAVFSAATDFRSSRFSSNADFVTSEFRRRGDFNETQFHAPAVFTDTRFVLDGVFLGAVFVYGGPDYGAEFNGVAAGGDLIFDLAAFRGDATFRRATAGGSLTFAGTEFNDDAELVFDGVRAESLWFGLDDVDQVVPGDRERVLGMLESSAKADGDLGIANDAHYRLQEIASGQHGFVRHTLDVVFYRWGAGYFVRPLRPLLLLIGLAAVASLVRVLRSGASPGGTRLRRVAAVAGRFAHELLDTLSLVAPTFGSGGSDGRQGRRLEIFAYRVLVVCALIGLANSNPTMRQMFDALL